MAKGRAALQTGTQATLSSPFDIRVFALVAPSHCFRNNLPVFFLPQLAAGNAELHSLSSKKPARKLLRAICHSIKTSPPFEKTAGRIRSAFFLLCRKGLYGCAGFQIDERVKITIARPRCDRMPTLLWPRFPTLLLSADVRKHSGVTRMRIAFKTASQSDGIR